jgi:hypothetical protein
LASQLFACDRTRASAWQGPSLALGHTRATARTNDHAVVLTRVATAAGPASSAFASSTPSRANSRFLINVTTDRASPAPIALMLNSQGR